MVKIPGGTFLMGSPDDDPNSCYDEHPQHLVTISSFYMSKTTITEEQWRFVASLPIKNRVLDKCPSKNGDNYPVINVSWEEAIEFCARLSRITEKNYRLPSEAEWEYACRAGTTTDFFFGDTLSENQANFYLMGRENGLMPVGQFPPNAFGLYDMHGNVWEWCQDNWHSNYNGAPIDGSAWLSGNAGHIIRGGSWNCPPWYCRSAYCLNLDYLSIINGFRVVCSSI
jgi:formylglycine-generating enzyme required for sulfatase activity